MLHVFRAASVDELFVGVVDLSRARINLSGQGCRMYLTVLTAMTSEFGVDRTEGRPKSCDE